MFEFDKSTGTILKLKDKTIIDLVIPDEIKGIKVKEIGWHAFENCTSLVNVTVPNTITRIGSYAFLGCNNLQYNVYDNAKYLGNKTNPYVVLMEAENKEITTCEIHPSTKVIYHEAFLGCYFLTNIIIPDSVTEIGAGAFWDCLSLTGITIGSKVAAIGRYAFRACTSLTSIAIPDSVTEIGDCAFYECSSLADVKMTNSIKTIGTGIFWK